MLCSHLTVAENAEWLVNVFWLDDLWGMVPKHDINPWLILNTGFTDIMAYNDLKNTYDMFGSLLSSITWACCIWKNVQEDKINRWVISQSNYDLTIFTSHKLVLRLLPSPCHVTVCYREHYNKWFMQYLSSNNRWNEHFKNQSAAG